MDTIQRLRDSVVQSGGVVSDSIRIVAPDNRERGVYVPLDAIDGINLSDEHAIVSIPGSLMITVKVALASEIVRSCASELERCGVSVNEATLIALFIFTERALGPRSKYGTYLNSLPQVGSGALFFGANELDLLEATPLAKAAEAKQRQLSKQFDCFLDVLHDWFARQNIAGTIAFNDYKWAHFIVLSRAISLASFAADGNDESFTFGEDYDRALLPVLDMFNHSGGSSSVRWVVENNHSVTVSICAEAAKRAPKVDIDGVAHVELCLSYGEKPNTEWLYEYGFIPRNNAHRAWPYLIGLAGSSELVSVKLLWMQELGLLPRIMMQDLAEHGQAHDISRETILALCLEALDDTLDPCSADVACRVVPAFPYFSINGDLLVDDEDKLLAVPGLVAHALSQCISRLEGARRTMLSNARASAEASAEVSASVHDYLVSEAELLSRIIPQLKNRIRATSIPEFT